MSLAWGSLVVLLLLLPGVLFFFGLHVPEQFTRESVERSAIGQLSAVLLVSLCVHALLICVNGLGVASFGWPPVDFEALIGAIVLEQRSGDSDNGLKSVAEMLNASRWWIFGYLSSSAVLGALVGYGFGRLIVPRVGGFSPHRWVFDLKTHENLTTAYVLTHVRQDSRILLYHGFLQQFALKRDGTFAYVVLAESTRGYMLLDDPLPKTTPNDERAKIGSTIPVGQLMSESEEGLGGAPRGYLCIEGEDIANVYFACLGLNRESKWRWPWRPKVSERELVRDAVGEALGKLNKEQSDLLRSVTAFRIILESRKRDVDSDEATRD